MRLYHVVAKKIISSNGESFVFENSIKMTSYTMSHEECMIMISKMTQHKHRLITIEEAGERTL